MEFKIISRKDFPLLNRERVNVEVNFVKEATPKKNNLKKDMVNFLKVDENLLAIKHIYTKFGENKAKVIVNIYKDLDNLKIFEKKRDKKAKVSEKPAEE